MLRWLGLLLALGLATTSADAQVFKPKTPKTTKAKSTTSEDKPKKEKATPTKQSARTSPGKKRVTTKSKKSRPSEDADSAPKESDKDFVKITDDADAE